MEILDERYELKFIISNEQSGYIREQIGLYSKPDVQSGSDGNYEVSTIYFDTPQFDFYFAAEASRMYRRRIRLRYYQNIEQVKKVFFEIKEKIRDRTLKKRESIYLQDGLPREFDKIIQLVNLLSDQELKREISYIEKHYGLIPVLFSKYSRSAWYDNHSDQVRITIDCNIEIKSLLKNTSASTELSNLLSDGESLLEIKAINELPLWVHRLLSSGGLIGERYSKYNQGIKRAEIWR